MLLTAILCGALNYTVPTPAQPVQKVYECTMYTKSSDECGKEDGITASGTLATPMHTIAADDLPLGTKVIIDGQEYTIEDRFGGGLTGHMDIYTENLNYAKEFGKQKKTITFPGKYNIPPLQYYG